MVKSLGEINCHHQRSSRWAVVVEASSDLVTQWQECSGGAAARPETMLRVCKWNMRRDETEDQPLHNFGGRAEEGDWSVGRPLSLRFPGLEQRHYDGTHPYVRDTGRRIGIR